MENNTEQPKQTGQKDREPNELRIGIGLGKDGRLKVSNDRYLLLMDSIISKHGSVKLKAGGNAIKRAFDLALNEFVEDRLKVESIRGYPEQITTERHKRNIRISTVEIVLVRKLTTQ